MKIQKYHFWLLFFFIIFGFTFGMIIWTIKSAVNTPVYEDKSFLSTYHLVDGNYNNMMLDNSNFLKKYEVNFNINGNIVGLETDDIFLGQRSLEKNHKHKDFLILGENSISIVVKDKNSKNLIPNAKIELLLTRAIEENGDLEINNFQYNNGKYMSMVNISTQGHWNLTGKITVDNKKGYFFIKSNTKK